MAKNKQRRRTQRRRPSKQSPTKPAISDTKNEIIPIHVLTNINRFSTFIPAAFILYITYDMNRMLSEARRLLFVCLVLFTILVIVKVRVQQSTIGFFFNASKFDQVFRNRFRRYVVWLLTLSFFIAVVTAIPVLYVHGYVAKLTDWLQPLLPGKEKISDNLSLFIAFCLGAIVSGVLGNLAYDILKYAYKKMRGKDSKPS